MNEVTEDCAAAERETELIEGVDLSKVNANHNPARDPGAIQLAPYHLLLLRFPVPEEETRNGIIVPAVQDAETMDFQPNCARVVGRSGKCDTPLGAYVFFPQRVPAEEEYFRKPQPLCFNYSDEAPVLWTFDERYATAVVPHGGDPVWMALPDDVMQLGLTDKWTKLSSTLLGRGSVFMLKGDSEERAYYVMKVDKPEDKEQRRGAKVRVYAFDYGPVLQGKEE